MPKGAADLPAFCSSSSSLPERHLHQGRAAAGEVISRQSKEDLPPRRNKQVETGKEEEMQKDFIPQVPLSDQTWMRRVSLTAPQVVFD